MSSFFYTILFFSVLFPHLHIISQKVIKSIQIIHWQPPLLK